MQNLGYNWGTIVLFKTDKNQNSIFKKFNCGLPPSYEADSSRCGRIQRALAATGRTICFLLKQSVLQMHVFLAALKFKAGLLQLRFSKTAVWYFAQSLMDTTKNIHTYSVRTPYSIFCAFALIKHGLLFQYREYELQGKIDFLYCFCVVF